MEGQGPPGEHEHGSERKRAVGALKQDLRLNQILGHSPAIQRLRDNIESLSSCDICVLICGETGTGKELAARAIHYLGHRADNPFVPVNCGAIPESLFENELFGHVKGAFTDAHCHQWGLVEQASGGTLFLDEIDATSLRNQVKLLRLLEDGEYRPLGDPTSRKTDLRVIAATNADLRQNLSDSTFREDLFYRLNVVTLRMPPLRERIEDVPLLAQHFLEKYSREYGRPVDGLSSQALQTLMSYSWPGNVRELESRIQHMIVMSFDPLIEAETAQLPPTSACARTSELGDFGVAKKKVIDSFEENYLTRLLTEYEGDVASAARRAGKSRTGLWNLIRKHGLFPKQFRHCRDAHSGVPK